VGLSIIKEIQQKIEKLKIPKYISCRPVLIPNLDKPEPKSSVLPKILLSPCVARVLSNC